MRRRRSWSRVARLAACVAVVAALARSERSQAQELRSVSDSLPRELVEALLRPYIGFYSSSSSKFVIGKLPESLAPYFFVPANARILGGIDAPTTKIVVLTVPMSYEDVRVAYQREQPKLGWEPPPSFEAMRGWGFMPAPGSTPDGSGLEFCHIGQSLEIRMMPETPTTSHVTATVQNFGGRCNMDLRAGGRPPTPTELPTLTNPAGSAMNSPTCSPGPFFPSGGGGTTERLQTSLTPQQLLETFARQLSDSGWTAGETVTTIRRSWTRPEGNGALVRELTVTAGPMLNAPAGCREVSMQVRRVPKR